MASARAPAAAGARRAAGRAAMCARPRRSPTISTAHAAASPSRAAAGAGRPQASALASTPPRRPSASTASTPRQPMRAVHGSTPAGPPRPAHAASSSQSIKPASQPAMWAPPCVQPVASNTSVSAPSAATPSPMAVTAPRDRGASGAGEGGLGRVTGFRAWTGGVGAGLIVVGRCACFTAPMGKGRVSMRGTSISIAIDGHLTPASGLFRSRITTVR